LRFTGRDARAFAWWRNTEAQASSDRRHADPIYTDKLELTRQRRADAGRPKRPQRVPLRQSKHRFEKSLKAQRKTHAVKNNGDKSSFECRSSSPQLPAARIPRIHRDAGAA